DPMAGGQSTAHTSTVVHIEDNLANHALIERIMGQRPAIHVLPATDGRLGIELTRRHHPDLVLLDLHLPGLGGEEVLRVLKHDPATTAVPVVMLSADGTPGQIER